MRKQIKKENHIKENKQKSCDISKLNLNNSDSTAAIVYNSNQKKSSLDEHAESNKIQNNEKAGNNKNNVFALEKKNANLKNKTEKISSDEKCDNEQVVVLESEKENTKRKFNKEEMIQILKFVGFSISAGIIQIVAFTLLNELINWSYWPSYLIALTLSVLWNFTLNREFTFKSANNVPLAMLLVGLYYLAFTPLSTWCGEMLTAINWNEYLVLFLTMVVNMTTEFLFCKFVVYKNSINTNKRAKKSKTE